MACPSLAARSISENTNGKVMKPLQRYINGTRPWLNEKMVSLDVHEKLVDITKIKNAEERRTQVLSSNGNMKEDDDKEDDQ